MDADARQALDSSGDRAQAGVARDLSELARELDAELGPDAVMQRIVAAAVEQIHGATGAAVTLYRHGQASSPAHTDAVAERVGLAEAQLQQGPCVDTSRGEVTLRVDDLRADSRWPEWAAAAIDNGVLSVLSYQLFVQTDSMGALNVYGGAAGAFDAEAESTGLLLASHAAIALSGSRAIANLNAALSSRDAIGQAKGILMERYKIDALDAFDLLVASSHRTGRKLMDVAAELARTGVVPTGARTA